jgi:hypothetical protein
LKTILNFLIFLSLSVSANKPSCDSPFVRLSLKPVACFNQGIPDGIFDIPELKLDLKDIEKIFQGAESSGGRMVGPMNQPRMPRPVTPFPVTLECELKLLSDGGKRVSFLSKQRTFLTQSAYHKTIPANLWVHGLISGNDINSTLWRPVPMAPNLNLNNYSLELSYNELQDELELNLCEDFIDPMGGAMSSFCGQGQSKSYEKTIQATLKGRIQSGDFKVIKNLKASCHIR